MTGRWDSYLVRALNELASLTRAFRRTESSAVRAKVLTSSAQMERPRKNKSSGRRNKRNTIGFVLLLILTLTILKKMA